MWAVKSLRTQTGGCERPGVFRLTLSHTPHHTPHTPHTRPQTPHSTNHTPYSTHHTHTPHNTSHTTLLTHLIELLIENSKSYEHIFKKNSKNANKNKANTKKIKKTYKNIIVL